MKYFFRREKDANHGINGFNSGSGEMLKAMQVEKNIGQICKKLNTRYLAVKRVEGKEDSNKVVLQFDLTEAYNKIKEVNYDKNKLDIYATLNEYKKQGMVIEDAKLKRFKDINSKSALTDSDLIFDVTLLGDKVKNLNEWLDDSDNEDSDDSENEKQQIIK